MCAGQKWRARANHPRAIRGSRFPWGFRGAPCGDLFYRTIRSRVAWASVVRASTLCPLFRLTVCMVGFFGLAMIQDSSKGGAVETGCSDLYDVMHSFII